MRAPLFQKKKRAECDSCVWALSFTLGWKCRTERQFEHRQRRGWAFHFSAAMRDCSETLSVAKAGAD